MEDEYREMLFENFIDLPKEQQVEVINNVSIPDKNFIAEKY